MELRHVAGMENGSHDPDSTIIANCITEHRTGDTTVEGDIIHSGASCTEGDVVEAHSPYDIEHGIWTQPHNGESTGNGMFVTLFLEPVG